MVVTGRWRENGDFVGPRPSTLAPFVAYLVPSKARFAPGHRRVRTLRSSGDATTTPADGASRRNDLSVPGSSATSRGLVVLGPLEVFSTSLGDRYSKILFTFHPHLSMSRLATSFPTVRASRSRPVAANASVTSISLSYLQRSSATAERKRETGRCWACFRGCWVRFGPKGGQKDE